MDIHVWFTYLLACIVLTMTPGPSILLGVVHSLSYGAKNTVFTALGDISANFIQMVLVAVGLGVVISTSEIAFQIIKWFGVITLLYMGIKMIKSKPKKIDKNGNISINISRKKLFIKGFLVAAGNPKAIVFFTAFFPQFIDLDKSLFTQMAIMCPTMALMDFSFVMFYALSATKFLNKFEKNIANINKVGGGALIGASGFLAISSKHN
ncbi:lysine transporter LysE [Halarcobacter ebronensis]|uniref:Lysine transporter LysE n=1 Tax=Halarcobacter ebronensis TaxID=1462615 RepID=A0A4Q0YG58_9BACT|nr:LysE family translocator [Halarcobacter ebronensis]RXJ68019.1 lysine transporter LysE [Halarcobacter ebronensis]